MSEISTMDDFSRKAVEEFLQTVVFVDDKIYAPSSNRTFLPGGKKVATPIRRKPATKTAEETATINSEERYTEHESKPPFFPHDIQSSFAKKHIVCSLHQPRKSHSVGIGSDTYKLCLCADIIIVDWDLYGDAGVKAKTLVKNLVIQNLEADPHQLRLVLIYTDTLDLFDISNQIFEELDKNIPDKIDYKDNDKGLAFHTLNARVVALGKPTERRDEFKEFEVKESELADRAVIEFCKLANGMLQGAVLMGLAAIRKQSRRILTKFHSGLDASFLSHRALGLPHEEAFEHITPLLVAEIEAVLEDSLPKPWVNDATIRDWCKKWTPAKHATEFVGQEYDTCEFATDFCTKGMGIADGNDTPKKKSDLKKTITRLKQNSPTWPSTDSSAFKTLTSYLSNDANGDDLRELSVLMSQRTYYKNHRHLSLGAIIRESEGDKRYLICLQPTCDCVRLKESSTFIFCLLQEAKEGQKSTHVVPHTDDAGRHVDLMYKPKSENCVTLIFTPTESKGLVTAKKNKTRPGFAFQSGDNKSYQWIAQLKPKHAQRAVEQFARELSRVGLTESEWLRLKAKP